jgi:hypothetical protein
MNSQVHSPSSSDTPADWLDQLLAREAADHAADYIADNGFTAHVLRMLPVADALPAWRQPVVVALWLIAAALLAITLPGTAHEVAREAFKLFAAQPFSLSTIAIALAAIGIATWTGAAVALRRD